MRCDHVGSAYNGRHDGKAIVSSEGTFFWLHAGRTQSHEQLLGHWRGC